MKKILLFFMCFLLTIGLAGCSKDGNSEITPGEPNYEEIPSTGDGNDNAIISVNFLLQDESGSEKYNFNEGENIIFRLDIKNNSDYDIFYGPKNADIIFGEDLFCVYSDDGNIVGLPWTSMYCEYTGQQFFIIPANTVMHIYCPWNLCKINSSHPLCKGDDKEKLPVGNYYTSFSIACNKNIASSNKQMTEKMIQANFKVQ